MNSLVTKSPEIYRIKLKMPFKLNHNYCYAVKGATGWDIIDAGLNLHVNKQAWLNFFQDHGIGKGEVKGIYITHHHRDHFGLAGWLQQITGAPVYVSPQEVELIRSAFQNNEQYTIDVAVMYKRHGAPPELIEQLIENMSQAVAFVDSLPKISLLEDKAVVQLGHDNFLVLITPGHTDGHVCFCNEEKGVMFTGDHLLPKIASSICWWPNGNHDPLKSYFQSMQLIKDLRCGILLPGHGDPFANIPERIDQLNTQNSGMLKVIQDVAGTGMTVYEICNGIFGRRLGLSRMRFAMPEILAYAMFLVYQGKLTINEVEGISIFSGGSNYSASGGI